jgi:DNA-binding MarR family transcriptional regulator
MKASHIKDIRAFNRFYTRIMGVLDGYILNSNYSLPEVRILFELYHNEGLTASDIIMLLGIDKGYLSRILQNFEGEKLVSKLVSKIIPKSDKRSASLQLTAKGKKEFEKLNTASDLQVKQTFEKLSEADCEKLVQKMKEIQQLIQKN